MSATNLSISFRSTSEVFFTWSSPGYNYIRLTKTTPTLIPTVLYIGPASSNYVYLGTNGPISSPKDDKITIEVSNNGGSSFGPAIEFPKATNPLPIPTRTRTINSNTSGVLSWSITANELGNCVPISYTITSDKGFNATITSPSLSQNTTIVNRPYLSEIYSVSVETAAGNSTAFEFPTYTFEPFTLKFNLPTSYTIGLPITSTDYYVDWGNNVTTINTSTYNYTSSGEKIVKIYGNLSQFGNSSGSAWNGSQYLTEITSFGNFQILSLPYAFIGTSLLTFVPNVLPNTVTNLYGTFKQSAINDANINLWNVSNVTNMSDMFNGTTIFNQDLNSWNVSKVTNMDSMFKDAISFNNDITSWNTTNVINMSSLFYHATSFNQNINNWNVSNVINTSNMFNGANVFNQNLNTWDVSKVTNMDSMFKDAISFNNDVTTWNTSNVINMNEMYNNATNFNQGIYNWNVINVTNMKKMFLNTAFDQDLNSWNISNVTNMENMFDNSNLSNVNYCLILNGWASQEVEYNVILGALGKSHLNAIPAYRTLTSAPISWTINDSTGVLDVPTSPIPNSIVSTAKNLLELTWLAPTANGNVDITLYHITTQEDPSIKQTINYPTSNALISYTDAYTYTYKITAENAIGNSEPATFLKLTPIEPSTPMNLSRNYIDGNLVLSWETPEVLGVPPVNTFDIIYNDNLINQRVTYDGASSYSANIDQTVYGTLGNLLIYNFGVTANNTVANSTVAYFDLFFTPNEPINLIRDFIDGNVVLTWQRGTEIGNPNIDHFGILYNGVIIEDILYEDNKTTFTANIDSTVYDETINLLTDSIGVTSYNTLGNSYVETFDIFNLPSQPINLTRDFVDGNVVLTWQKGTELGNPNIDHFGVLYNNNEVKTVSYNTNTSTFTANIESTIYGIPSNLLTDTIGVKSYNALGNSDVSTFDIYNLPNEPVNLTRDFVDGNVVLTWEKGTELGNPNIDHFGIIYNNNEVKSVLYDTNTSTFTANIESTIYGITSNLLTQNIGVKSYNALGNSSVSTFELYNLPNEPVNLIRDFVDGNVVLTWEKGTELGNPNIDHFGILYNNNEVKSVLYNTNTSTFTANIESSIYGNTSNLLIHNISVTSYNGIGNSAVSTFELYNLPNEPVNLTRDFIDGNVVLTWQKGTELGNPNIDHFGILYNNNEVKSVLYDTNTATFTANIESIIYGNTSNLLVHNIGVTSYNGIGNSSVSIFELYNLPNQPTNLIKDFVNNNVVLKWRAANELGNPNIDHFGVIYNNNEINTIPYNANTLEYVTNVDNTVFGELSNLLVYNFGVTAHNTIGNSNISAYDVFDLTGTPYNLNRQLIDGNVVLFWTASNDLGDPNITQFNILYDNSVVLNVPYVDGTNNYTSNIDASVYGDASNLLTKNIGVTSVQTIGNSAVATFELFDLPGNPTIINRELIDGNVVLTWSVSTDYGDPIIDHFNIIYDNNIVSSVSYVSGTSTYTSNVEASTYGDTLNLLTKNIGVSGVGTVGSSGVSTFNLFDLPGNPTIISRELIAGNVVLTWSVSNDYGDPIIDHFNIIYDNNVVSSEPYVNGSTIYTSNVETSTYGSVSNLLTKDISISGVNGIGNSSVSTFDHFTLPGKPTNVSTSIVNNLLTLSWNANTEVGTPIVDHFSILYNNIEITTVAYNGSSTYSTTIDKSIYNDTLPIKSFGVSAYNTIGNSDVSSTTLEPFILKFGISQTNTLISLPITGSNYTIYWGDNNTINTNIKSHTYTNPGEYVVEIYGSVTQFGNSNYSLWTGSEYLTNVLSFGNLGINSLIGSFRRTPLLTKVPRAHPISSKLSGPRGGL